MAVRTILTDLFPEMSTARITGQFLDETGVGIPSSSFSTLTLTLYAEGQPTVYINGRNKQNVLNANGVTVDSQGNFVWTMAPADNTIMNPAYADVERHIALFEWTWAGGSKEGNYEIVIPVQNLANVP